MKNFKEQVEGFKKWLAASFAEEPAAGDVAPVDSLKEYETTTGAKVKIDKLEVGGKVFQEDGTTPVMAGFVLADGTDVQVDPMGVITAVTVPAVEPVAAAAPPVAPALPPAAPAPMHFSEQVRTEFAEQMRVEFKTQLDELKKSYDAQAKKNQEAIGKIVTLMEQFAAQPGGDPVQMPAGPADPYDTKMERAANFIKTIRKESEAIGAD